MTPYIDFWQDTVHSQSTWLKLHLEKAYRLIVARAAAASKCREKCKKPEKSTHISEGFPRSSHPLM
jgi:hypothetical protein